MIAILAEKPSVAREIAAIVGAHDKKNGYLCGNNYMVTWALGHLVELAMPEEYGIAGFSPEQLPIIPDTFKLVPRRVKTAQGYQTDSGALKQLKTIESVFNSSDSLIVATDAGREGCLIFRYIYSYLGCTKPFKRLWISSLTEEAIRKGLSNLREGSDYDKLYQAAQARSQADWLVGINASQALSIAAGQGVFSLGRVQTPTLSMVCSRYLEHTNFTPTPYWELRLDTSCGNKEFSALSKEPIESRLEAKALYEKQRQLKSVLVQSVDKHEVIQEPPLLYDLTTLQKEANIKYGFSADTTLSVAQSLYEKHKLITYPRTGSRYIPDDVFNEIPSLIEKLSSHRVFGSSAKQLADQNLNIRSVDAKKVTDHHALLITGYTPGSISYDERKIYDLIAGRMLEAFSEKCIKDRTSVVLNCSDVLYAAEGLVTRIPGWRDVQKEKDEKTQEKELPTLVVGQELLVNQIQLLEKLTRAKPLHTEAGLLSAMETAGKLLESEEQRLALKSCGIGTPATRASIIETLFRRDYMRREQKSLVSTEKGLAVYGAVKDKRIADVEMTGMWEDAFVKIESAEADAANFQKGIEVYAAQITKELLSATLSLPAPEKMDCPRCGTALTFYPKVVKCANEACKLTVFTHLSDKFLPVDAIKDLLSGKQTPIIKGFKSKTGKRFDAALKLDKNYRIEFVFLPKKGRK